MKASVDKDLCISCGLCAGTCPEVFRLTDDGPAEAYADPTPENSAAAKEAEENCPVSAIKTAD